MFASRDRAVHWQHRKRIRHNDQVFERHATLFRRHILRAQETPAGSDGLRVGLGECRTASRGIHLHDHRVAAGCKRFSLQTAERRFAIAEHRPAFALLEKQRLNPLPKRPFWPIILQNVLPTHRDSCCRAASSIDRSRSL
jgi:hypothetical protein